MAPRTMMGAAVRATAVLLLSSCQQQQRGGVRVGVKGYANLYRQNHQRGRRGRLNSSTSDLSWFSSSSSPPPPDCIVSSTRSNTMKTIQQLLQPRNRKKRAQLGETVAEGPRIVLDLLANPSTRQLVRQVLVSTDKWDEYYPQLLNRQKENHDDNDNNSFQILAATPDVLDACTDTVTTQGILARVAIPPPHLSLADCLVAYSTAHANSKAPPLFLIADGIADPGNLGTLIRSCVATGVAGLLLLPQCCDVWNPKVVRSAMGASFSLPLVYYNNNNNNQQLLHAGGWEECRHQLESVQCRSIYAATMLTAQDTNNDGTSLALPSISHYHVDWTNNNRNSNSSPIAVIVGNEGNGLSEPVRLAIHEGRIQAVHLPMASGAAVESLNAAVCASVILFEYYRQCHFSTATKPISGKK